MTCRTLFGRWCSASGLSSDRRCCKFALCDKPPRDRILAVLLANTASVCRCLYNQVRWALWLLVWDAQGANRIGNPLPDGVPKSMNIVIDDNQATFIAYNRLSSWSARSWDRSTCSVVIGISKEYHNIMSVWILIPENVNWRLFFRDMDTDRVFGGEWVGGEAVNWPQTIISRITLNWWIL